MSEFKFNENAKYNLIAPSSMGVRITPLDRTEVFTSNLFRMQSTSAETNVLNVPASLGMNTLVLTTFVKDSQIAKFIKSELRKRNINFIGKDKEKVGPWGYRHQFNIADSGFGLRAPRVENDRAGEVGRSLSVDDFDLDKLFKEEKVEMIHMSGLIAALSPETKDFCLALARCAKKNGTIISFDLNYRASFWKDRKEELSKSFKEIVSLTDILIGNEEDYQLALGLKGPEAGGKDIASKIDGFKKMIETAKAEYKNVKVFATTLRQVISANEHLWGAISYSSEGWNIIEPRPIEVMDRIGGGDGFVGGLLYSILKGESIKTATEFGWATGVLAASSLNDYATPVDEDEVWSIYSGNARVKR